MSQPPQQPGPYGQPDPYGQQPGMPGQPTGGFGQQPGGFGQQPGYGQQPGFPQTGPQPGYEQPGYGPPTGGFGQPPSGGFPQQGYGGYPGGPGGMPKKNKALPWILAGGGVVVVGVAVVLLFVFGVFGGSASSSPDNLASAIATALTNNDVNGAAKLVCGGKPADAQDMLKGVNEMGKVTATVNGKAAVSGSSATVVIHLSVTKSGHTLEEDLQLAMKQQSGNWCFPSDGAGSKVVPGSEKIDGKPMPGQGGMGGDSTNPNPPYSPSSQSNGGGGTGGSGGGGSSSGNNPPPNSGAPSS